MLTDRRQEKKTIVGMDNFTKWAEAESLTDINKKKRTIEFIQKNLICRFGIPNAIVSDNEK